MDMDEDIESQRRTDTGAARPTAAKSHGRGHDFCPSPTPTCATKDRQ